MKILIISYFLQQKILKKIYKRNYRPWRRPRFPTDIQPIRKLFEDSPPNVVLPPIVETPVATKHFFPQRFLDFLYFISRFVVLFLKVFKKARVLAIPLKLMLIVKRKFFVLI